MCLKCVPSCNDCLCFQFNIEAKGETLHVLFCDIRWRSSRLSLTAQLVGFQAAEYVSSAPVGGHVAWVPTHAMFLFSFSSLPLSHKLHCPISKRAMRWSFHAFWKLIPKALHLKTGNFAAPSCWPSAICQLSNRSIFFKGWANTYSWC